MKKGNIITSILVIALSIYVIIVCAGYPTAEAYGTGVPGPGLWPMAVAILMLIAAVILLIKSIRMKPEEDTSINMWTDGTKRVYISMGILIAYVALLGVLGFIISTAVMLFVFMQWFSKKNPLITMIISIVCTMAIYSVFRFLLNVPVNFGLFYI
ncbi:MAG: tripartite tricarboxylate transporter TctB family protein [Clostridium sp.]|nr:tripartite tricarboxylate transporter TctB family protein [Clostridium sp.]